METGDSECFAYVHSSYIYIWGNLWKMEIYMYIIKIKIMKAFASFSFCHYIISQFPFPFSTNYTWNVIFFISKRMRMRTRAIKRMRTWTRSKTEDARIYNESDKLCLIKILLSPDVALAKRRKGVVIPPMPPLLN